MPKTVKYHPEVDLLEHEDATAPETKRVLVYGWDAVSLAKVRMAMGVNGELLSSSQPYAMKITESGSNTYIASAPSGTAQATAGWKAMKITESGSDTTITWADGNAKFDNTATDLTAHTYS